MLTAEMVELVGMEVILVKGVMAATGVRQTVATVLVRVMAATAARLTAAVAVPLLAAMAAQPLAGMAIKAAEVEMLMEEMVAKGDLHQQQQSAQS